MVPAQHAQGNESTERVAGAEIRSTHNVIQKERSGGGGGGLNSDINVDSDVGYKSRLGER